MKPLSPPICDTCVHLHGGATWSCTAFPNGIPDPIFMSEADHHEPYPGDNGVVYTRDPEKPLPGIDPVLFAQIVNDPEGE